MKELRFHLLGLEFYAGFRLNPLRPERLLRRYRVDSRSRTRQIRHLLRQRVSTALKR